LPVFEFQTLILFFGASVMLGLAPGPDNIFVLTQSTLNGPRAGILVTLGLCTGILVHTVLVAFGLAAIFATSDLAFTAVKTVGACYLLYLAWQAFRAKPEAIDSGEQPKAQGLKLYGRGIIMNVTNPKVAIFFLAFLPQFANPAAGAMAPQMIVLGLVFIVATLLVFGSVALLAGKLGDRLRKSPAAQIWLNRIAGTIFIGLAARLVFQTR